MGNLELIMSMRKAYNRLTVRSLYYDKNADEGTEALNECTTDVQYSLTWEAPDGTVVDYPEFAENTFSLGEERSWTAVTKQVEGSIRYFVDRVVHVDDVHPEVVEMLVRWKCPALRRHNQLLGFTPPRNIEKKEEGE